MSFFDSIIWIPTLAITIFVIAAVVMLVKSFPWITLPGLTILPLTFLFDLQVRPSLLNVLLFLMMWIGSMFWVIFILTMVLGLMGFNEERIVEVKDSDEFDNRIIGTGVILGLFLAVFISEMRD